MNYGQRKKSTGTRGTSQAGSAKDAIRTNDGGTKNPEHGLNLSAKHLQKAGGGGNDSFPYFGRAPECIMKALLDGDENVSCIWQDNVGFKIKAICSSESFADIERLIR